MPKYLKGKAYTTMIRPVLMYGAEAWAVTRREGGLLERTAMRMLRWILGVSLNLMKRKGMRSSGRHWGWRALRTKYERPDCDGMVM